MCKKLTLGVLGFALLGGLLFGGKVIPYAQTAFRNVRAKAQESVPVQYQIDAAKIQLEKIGPEIKDMVWQIAKEKAAIKKLGSDLKKDQGHLEASYAEMMTLREHVQSGDKFYVATNGRAYNKSRVEEDLRHRFELYQTAEKTIQKKAEILEIRQKSLNSAFAKLDQAKAQKRELEVQIENLSARNRMNEVVATASQINIDNSELSATREMLEDIDALVSAKEELLNIAPKYYGQIPVNAETTQHDTDILSEIDAYFDTKSNSDSDESMVDDDDLVLN
ncbi:MAG: hypothetical protein AAF939_03760 [Planctomycetota bacterium]